MSATSLSLFLSMIFGFLLFGITLLRNRGNPTVMWALTTLPFILMAANLIADSAGYVEYAVFRWIEQPVAATVLCALAIFLFGVANGTHKEMPVMWHQDKDRVSHLVTWGIYSFIRHPFYTSYHVFFAACLLARPTIGTLFCSVYAWSILYYTALKEERELTGLFGDEYRAYMSTTNRFLPGMRLIHHLYKKKTGKDEVMAPATGEMGHAGRHVAGYGAAGVSGRRSSPTP